jgi:hypothetical protein
VEYDMSDPAIRDLLDGIEDLDEPDEPPAPQPPPRPAGPYHPTQRETQEFCELSERGSFRPLTQVKPKAPPSWSRSKWGKACNEWQKKPGKIK